MSVIVSDIATCIKCNKEYHYSDHAAICPHAKIGMYDCPCCGNPLVEVEDSITKTKTGHLFMCQSESCVHNKIVFSIG